MASGICLGRFIGHSNSKGAITALRRCHSRRNASCWSRRRDEPLIPRFWSYSNQFIRFPNGRTLRLGEEINGLHDDIWHTQIKHTIRRHLDKELQVRERGIKVLSLFFIDRVASYRDYGGAGRPIQGKLPRFEVELTTLARDERYCVLTWLQEPIDKLHNG